MPSETAKRKNRAREIRDVIELARGIWKILVEFLFLEVYGARLRLGP